MHPRILVFSIALGLYTGKSSAFLSVEILKISQDQKSLILSVGAGDGVREDDDGKLYEFDGTTSALVADLSAVKSNNTHSYWVVERIFKGHSLRQGQTFQFEFLSNEFRNRKSPTIQVNTVVQEDYPNEYAQEGLLKDPVFEEKVFQSQDVDEEEPVTSSETIHRKQRKIYQKIQEDNRAVLKPSFSKAIDTRQVRENVVKEKFHEEIESFVNKFNKSGKGLIYNLDTGSDDRNIHLYPKSRNLDDPLWSKALDEDELLAFYRSNAVVKERQFRDTVVSGRPAHEIFMKYATALQEYTDKKDSFYQGRNSSLSFGYEYFLGRHFLRLKNFSINGFYSKGRDYFHLTTNTKVDYSGMGANIQYYFSNDPRLVEKLLLFTGLGAETGSGTLRIRTFDEGFASSHFSLLADVGIKYRFKDMIRDKGISFSLGTFLLLGHRRTRYSLDSQIDELIRESFDTDIQSSENKIYLGMSLYF